jgi:hypothetical protein
MAEEIQAYADELAMNRQGKLSGEVPGQRGSIVRPDA